MAGFPPQIDPSVMQFVQSLQGGGMSNPPTQGGGAGGMQTMMPFLAGMGMQNFSNTIKKLTDLAGGGRTASNADRGLTGKPMTAGRVAAAQAAPAMAAPGATSAGAPMAPMQPMQMAPPPPPPSGPSSGPGLLPMALKGMMPGGAPGATGPSASPGGILGLLPLLKGLL